MADEKPDRSVAPSEAGANTPTVTTPIADEGKVNYQTRDGATVAMDYASIPAVGDVVESGLWPDLEKVESKDLIGEQIVVLDSTDEMVTDLGKYCIIRILDPKTQQEATTAVGWTVPYQKFQTLRRSEKFPVVGTFVEITREGKQSYHDFV